MHLETRTCVLELSIARLIRSFEWPSMILIGSTYILDSFLTPPSPLISENLVRIKLENFPR